MKFIEGSPVRLPVIELSRRNLEVLLAKLDDPLSNRGITDGVPGHITVRAIEGDGDYSVRAVENSEHYSDRRPGVMYMPTADEYV